MSLVLTPEQTKDNLEVFVMLIVLFLFVNFLARALTEYNKERKTITRLAMSDSGTLEIELTDFDTLTRQAIALDKIDVTLKRSFRRDRSRLSIDFWFVGSEPARKIVRQHSNSVWESRDVKAVFIKIKELKCSRLTQSENDILNDAEFS